MTDFIWGMATVLIAYALYVTIRSLINEVAARKIDSRPVKIIEVDDALKRFCEAWNKNMEEKR